MAEADPQISQDESLASAEPAAAPVKRRWGRLVLMLSLPAILLVGGLLYWQSLQGKVGTDNAYLKQDMVGVSAEVVGKIVEVAVQEGDMVQAGDLLFRIDPEPYRLQIAEADAAMATAQANLTALSNAPELTGVDIAAAREDIAFAQATLERQEALWRSGFTTKADYEAAESRFDAYPGLVLKGHVASIGAGTGSEFSVLPAQNATGNWVKVTQRVPVRIAIDEKSPRPLIAGLSTEVTVFTDGRKL